MKLTIEEIAKVCHQVNKSYCEAIGDFSQPEWVDAPSWQKESAIAGVKFHIDNPNSKPSDSHKSWMKQKIADGWIYGEVKDLEKKTHPDLIPYEELPVEQKAKDYIFSTLARELSSL